MYIHDIKNIPDFLGYYAIFTGILRKITDRVSMEQNKKTETIKSNSVFRVSLNPEQSGKKVLKVIDGRVYNDDDSQTYSVDPDFDKPAK